MKNVLSHYRIRKLWPLETGAFRRHLLRLDEETRQFRFGTAVNDNFLDAYADTARRIGTVIYGAFIGPDIYASAELRPLHIARDKMAEAAFVVESAHRHMGLGSALMERVITAAQNRGVEQLHMICARDNRAMQQLAGKFGARFRIDDAEALAEIAPAQATPLSLLDEALHDTTGFVTAVLDWSASPTMPRKEPRHIRHHRG